MSSTLEVIRGLVAVGELRISEHGYDELSEDGIRIRDVLAGLSNAVVVEDYPTFGKGRPCWRYDLIQKGVHCTLFGAFQRDYPGPQF